LAFKTENQAEKVIVFIILVFNFFY
jgi:hypothetical protein